MNNLQSLAYKATNTTTAAGTGVIQDQNLIYEEIHDPATPMAQRIPLSDLISNTPRAQQSNHGGSPEDKVVWKLSPKKGLQTRSASQQSPKANMTTFLPFVDQDTSNTNVSL
jgi:hypothetical protein